MLPEYKYRAFISYSHKDEKGAAWLHRALETFRVPKYLVGAATAYGPLCERVGSIFRDRDELATASDLGSQLTQALTDSACLVVICSPNAARSHWTNEEIRKFKQLGRGDRIYSLIVAGEPGAGANPDTIDQECFPPALRYEIDASGALTDIPCEPIAADVRAGGDGKQNAKLKILSGILGVGFDALKQRDLHRRHRRLVYLSAAAVTGMVIATGLATVALMARNEAQQQRNEAQQQRARAENEAAIANKTTDFMVGLFKVSDPSEALGNTITARQILDKGVKRIQTELNDQPGIQATLMDTMGRVYTSLGLYKPASDLLAHALATMQTLDLGDQQKVADVMDNLASAQGYLADYDSAQSLYTTSLALRAPGSLQRANTLTGLAYIEGQKGEYEKAAPLILESLAIRRKLLGDSHAEIAENLEDLGQNYYQLGDYKKAIDNLRSAVEMRRALQAGPYPGLSEALTNLAVVLQETGKYDDAEALYREALAMDRKLLGNDHPELSTSISNLALLLKDKGDLDAAEPLYKEVIERDRRLLGDSHPMLADSLNNYAMMLVARKDLDSAVKTEREALSIYEKAYGDSHPKVADALSTLGFMLTQSGHLEEAEPILVRALKMRRTLFGADSPDVAKSLLTVARLHLDTREFTAAASEAKQAQTIFTKRLGPNHWLTGAALSVYGAAQVHERDTQDGVVALLRGYDIMQKDGGAMPSFMENAAKQLADFYAGKDVPVQPAGRATPE